MSDDANVSAPVDGEPRAWRLRGYDFDTQGERAFEFHGQLLGEGSSRRPRHERLVHPEGRFAVPGDRCSACRWFEVRIYAVQDPTERPAHRQPRTTAGYYIETVGRSIVPGEVDRRRVRRVFEPHRVVSTLVTEQEDRVFLPYPSRVALDLAADADERLARVVDELGITS